jgi:hypothetical protein
MLALALLALDVSHAPAGVRMPRDRIVQKGEWRGIEDLELGLKLARSARVPALLFFCAPW